MRAPLLLARGLIKRYGSGEAEVEVLRGIDLTLERGELTLLMGPSGSGKTTLVSILAGLMRPSAGEVSLCGAPISTLDEAAVARVRRTHIGFVFQTYNLFPALSALDNVALGYRMRGEPKAVARVHAQAALQQLGLSARAGFLPGKLSSGQKQRVAIARALAASPALVIGDEPTAALDGPTAMEVMLLLQQCVTQSSAVLVVTHDHRLERFAHRTLDMNDGRIVSEKHYAPDAEQPA